MKSSGSNQQGVAHILVIAVVVAVIAIIGVVVWKVSSKSKNPVANAPASTKAAASAAQSACQSKFHDTDLCNFVAAEAAHPYDQTASVVTLTTTTNGTTSTLTLSNDGRGNSMLAVPSGSGGDINTVVYGGHTYTQLQPGSAYYDSGASTSSTDSSSSDNSLKSLMADLSGVTYTKIGKEACGNLTCFKYQISDNLQQGATQYAWFDDQQYLMREYKTTGGGLGDIDMKIAYQAVTVSKPSNIQSMSSVTSQ